MTTEPVPQVHRWRAFAVLAVAFFMTIVDLTIVNVALPTIGRDLHFSESDLQWVVTAYGITLGGFLLLGGRAADLLGRRRILMLGLAVFTAASLGAGLAASSGFLIAMRGLQGLGAAVGLPAALSIVMNMFAEGAERNKALGLWGGIGAAGATVGLIAGGLLTRYAGWQYIFFLNVPTGAAALLLAPRIVPESLLAGARRRFDPLGAVTVTGALLLLVYAISKAPQAAGVGPHGDAAGRLGGAAARLPGGRDARRGAAAATTDLPAARGSRRERRGAPARWQLLWLHLHRHPLHAAGAGLLGPASRGRLAGRLAHRCRARRARAAARYPHLGPAR